MKKAKKVSIEEIEAMAERGEDVTRYFNKGKMMPPLDIQRVNVDFTLQMLNELDRLSAELNISRQAVIKMLLMRGLDDHRLARQAGTDKRLAR
jgi:hypothetical protein